MSDATLPPACPDRNMLFGVIAMQLDFIGRPDLLQGLQSWGTDRGRALGDILVEKHALSARRRNLLEEVVEEYLVQHDNDPARGLTAACAARTVELDVAAFAGPAMRGNLATLPSAPSTLPGPATNFPPPPEYMDRVNNSGKRFRILRPHARGALGAVFLARDEELHREVALKEIQQPYASHPDSRARFLLEAEITGSLEHPGVVPVYGLNFHPDGRPYYAMRFIRGESLYEAIMNFHAADLPSRDPTERALSMRGLLSRFVAVCNAVEYAHSKGVIHRDIKPSNIMLGPYGETLVVDWGLAKVFDRPVTTDSQELPLHPPSSGSARATMLGQAVGTPSYMPPEQAAGKVDHVGPRSDVYSLGATLYNILTGMPPFPGDDASDVIEDVQKGQLVPPRRVKRDVPAALEAIVLKAMRFDARDRYFSAGALAQDMERWLADEPVQAYREPAWQQLRRWTRRHRTLVSAVGVLLVTTLVALGIGLVAVGHEQQRTARERDIAKANLELARKAVDKSFLVTTENPLFQQERNRAVRRLLLQNALPFYQQFKSQSPNNAELIAEEGSNLWRVASITADLDEKGKAVQPFQEAHAVFASLVAAQPTVGKYQFQLARIANDFANLQRDLGQRNQAQTSFEEAVHLLEGLVAAREDPADESLLASALNNLAVLRREDGEFDAALKLHKRALGLQEALARANPDNLRYQEDLAASQHNLGRFLAAQGKQKDALVAYQEARKIRARLVEKEPLQPTYIGELADTLHNMGQLYRELEDPKQAIQFFQFALEKQAELSIDLIRTFRSITLNLASTYNCDWRIAEGQRQIRRGKADVSQRPEDPRGAGSEVPQFPQVSDRAGGHLQQPRQSDPGSGRQNAESPAARGDRLVQPGDRPLTEAARAGAGSEGTAGSV